MPDLKPISEEAIPQALEKAMRYRLLNQPWQAESICRDILRTEPGNQKAIYTLILAMTDQFEGDHTASLSKTIGVIARLTDNYQSEYCRGLTYERQARAAFKRKTPRGGFIAYDHLIRAMKHYEEAETIRPASNEESILRWNACARFINKHKLQPETEGGGLQPFLDV